MTGRTQVRISGLGGQGVVLLGLLLGEAGAVMGKHVAGADSYGAQARGSGCKSEIVFSDDPIDYPHITTADILVGMSQGGYDAHCCDVKQATGLIIYDRSQVEPRNDLGVRQVGIPATECALAELNNKQAANMVLLGALVEITQVVSAGSVEKAMERHVAERFLKSDLEAFAAGRELGRRMHG